MHPRLGLARSNVIVTEQNLVDAQTNYQAMVGHAPANLSVPKSMVSLLPQSLSDAEQRAIEGHPTLKSAIADLKARFKQDEVAKSTFWPIIDFEIDKIFEDETSYSYDEREDLRLFLRLRYNLFNGWKDKARKEETEELIREAIEIKNHTFRQVIESIRLSWQAYQSANRRIAYLKERLQYSSSTANAYTQQWNINERTLLDVLDAEAERIDHSQGEWPRRGGVQPQGPGRAAAATASWHRRAPGCSWPERRGGFRRVPSAPAHWPTVRAPCRRIRRG